MTNRFCTTATYKYVCTSLTLGLRAPHAECGNPLSWKDVRAMVNVFSLITIFIFNFFSTFHLCTANGKILL